MVGHEPVGQLIAENCCCKSGWTGPSCRPINLFICERSSAAGIHVYLNVEPATMPLELHATGSERHDRGQTCPRFHYSCKELERACSRLRRNGGAPVAVPVRRSDMSDASRASVGRSHGSSGSTPRS